MMRQITFVLTSLALIAATGCRNDRPAPLQTISVKATTGAGPVAADQPPTQEERDMAIQRLDRAIAAHGGPVRLQKLRKHVQKRKGRLLTGKFGEVDSEQDLKLDFPERVRLAVKGFTPEGVQEITVALDGTVGWMKDASGARELPAEVIRDIADEFRYLRLITLLPLKDAEFVLRPIKGEPISGQPTVGIRVESKDERALNLYFDEKTNLLVGTLGQLRGSGILQRHEVIFSDHKPTDDVVLPTRIVDRRDGARWLNCSLEFKFVTEFDKNEFGKPN